MYGGPEASGLGVLVIVFLQEAGSFWVEGAIWVGCDEEAPDGLQGQGSKQV